MTSERGFGLRGLSIDTPPSHGPSADPPVAQRQRPALREHLETHIEHLTSQVRDDVLQHLDSAIVLAMNEQELRSHLTMLISHTASERHLLINSEEQDGIASELLNDIVAMGPLEGLLREPDISDILVNGPHEIYVERHGKLEMTDAHFRSDTHLLHVVQRIGASIGRRVDEQSPMLDARLADGSRVNVIIKPLSLIWVCLSIRRFSRTRIDFKKLVEFGSASETLARVLEIAARCRLNIIISGGTGSGKTTLLGAFSQHISHAERIITIEDVAELQLQQPHVIPLET